MSNGQGYLYANASSQYLAFTGTIRPYDDTYNIPVSAGWNLIGNPFPCDVVPNMAYHTLNNGTATSPVKANTGAVAPGMGFAVYAKNDREVSFNLSGEYAPALNNGSLQIALSQVPEPVEGPARNNGGVSTGSTTAILDNAIVSFNEGSELPKFDLMEGNAQIYLPQDGKDYAIAFSDGQGEMPLNFKATKDGTYTITVAPEGVELEYLHLIDNLTGADVDLLVTPTYTFTAKTTDYESRFKLVFFADEDGPSTGSGAFAYINNGNIIVNGEGTLQVIDVMGRVIVSGDAMNRVSTGGMTAGVYVLRLINGNDVKTQKIVIK